MQTARQLIEAYSSSSSADDLTTLAYVINYNFSFDYELAPDHIEAMRQNPDVLLTPTAKRNVNPLIVDMMLSSVSAGKHEWISQIKDLVTVDVLLHRYKVYNGIGAFAADLGEVVEAGDDARQTLAQRSQFRIETLPSRFGQ